MSDKHLENSELNPQLQQVVDNIEHIPEENRGRAIMHTLEMTSGPLPAPEQLAKYDEVVPGAADRIIAMAESNQTHRQENESKIINEELKFNERGQIYGFAITAGLIAAACYMVRIDSAIFGALFGISGAAGILTQIFKAILPQQKEKQKDISED